MKLSDIKPGMKLKANGGYADCIKMGDEFEAYLLEGALHINCRGPQGEGSEPHELEPMAEKGEIPELEPIGGGYLLTVTANYPGGAEDHDLEAHSATISGVGAAAVAAASAAKAANLDEEFSSLVIVVVPKAVPA